MKRTLDERAAVAISAAVTSCGLCSFCGSWISADTPHSDWCASVVIPEMQAEIAALKAQLSDKQGTIGFYEEQTETLTRVLRSLKAQLAAAEGDAEKRVCEVTTAGLAFLTRATKAEVALARTTAERDAARNRLAVVEGDGDSAHAVARKAESDLAAARAEIAAEQAKVAALSKIDERGIGHDDALSLIAHHVHEIEVLCDVFGRDPFEWLRGDDADEIKRLTADLSTARAEVERLTRDWQEAVRIAYEKTPDCSTMAEAARALVDFIKVSQARAEKVEAELAIAQGYKEQCDRQREEFLDRVRAAIAARTRL